MSTNPPIIHNSALVNAFDKMESKVKSILHGAHDFAVKLFGQPAVDKFDSTLKSLFEADVITIFQDAVTAAESLKIGGAPASGTEKQEAAFNQISSDLEASGKNLGTNAINLGIEMVVNLLHAKTPAQ